MSAGLVVAILVVGLGALGGFAGAMVSRRRTRATGLDIGGYRVHAILGGGSTSTVYLGRDASGRPVAVKVLHRLGSETQQQARARVDTEVAALRSVATPEVPKVVDVVDTAGGVAVITEYVDGATLTAVLAKNERLTGQQVLAVMEGALTGLAALHAAGLVHRDVKPDNIVVAPGGRSRLVDFGLVRPASDVGRGEVAGSPAYMSPEQAAGGPVDARSDVWSCGAVLYEALHGRRFDRSPPEAGGPLDDLVARALATDRELRPADAGELLAELREQAGRAFGADWRVGAAAGAVAAATGARVLRELPGRSATATASAGSAAGGIPVAATAVGVAVGLLVAGAVSVPVVAASGKPVAAVQTPTTSAGPSATTTGSSAPATTPPPSPTASSPTAAPVPLDLAALMVPKLLPTSGAGGAGVGPLTLAAISRPEAAGLFHPAAVRTAGFVVGRDSFATSFSHGGAEIDLMQLGSASGAQDWMRAATGGAAASVAGIPGGFAETVGGQQWIVFARGPVIALVSASGPDAAARLRALAAQQYARLAGVAG